AAEQRDTRLRADEVSAGRRGVRIDAGRICGRRRLGLRPVERDGKNAKVRVGHGAGGCAETTPRRVWRMQRLEIDGIVGERIAGAYARASVTVDIPRNAGARSEVVLVNRIELVEARSELNESPPRNEQRREVGR